MCCVLGMHGLALRRPCLMRALATTCSVKCLLGANTAGALAAECVLPTLRCLLFRPKRSSLPYRLVLNGTMFLVDECVIQQSTPSYRSNR
jgi:hypothetical protein